MKKLLSALIISIFVLTGLAIAEQQYQNNGVNVGIANKTNLVGCTITRSGEIATINCQSQAGPITVTGNLTVTGNETVSGTSTQSGPAVFSSTLTGLNWNEFPGGIGNSNWQVATPFSQGINWQAVPQGYTSGINWQGADILGVASNWTDIRAYATKFGGDHSGINWQSFGV